MNEKNSTKDRPWVSQVIHQDPRTGTYVGSPSLLRLPNGSILATSHDPQQHLLVLALRGGREHYHCAPVPVVGHNGRIYRAFEDNDETVDFAAGFKASVISASAESDLLDARSWVMSNKLAYDQETDPPEFGDVKDGMPGWLEGNVVIDTDGNYRSTPLPGSSTFPAARPNSRFDATQ